MGTLVHVQVCKWLGLILGLTPGRSRLTLVKQGWYSSALMCAALLKQSCLVEWSGNLVLSLGIVLFQFSLWCLRAVYRCLLSSSVICAFPPVPLWCNSQYLICPSLVQIYLSSKFWKLVKGHLCFLRFLSCEQSWQLLRYSCPNLSVSSL